MKKITNPHFRNLRAKSSNRKSIENLPNEPDLCRRLYPVTVLIQGACFLCGYSATVWFQFFPIQPLYDISLDMKSKICHFRVCFLLHTFITDIATITAAIYNFTTKPFFFRQMTSFPYSLQYLILQNNYIYQKHVETSNSFSMFSLIACLI